MSTKNTKQGAVDSGRSLFHSIWNMSDEDKKEAKQQRAFNRVSLGFQTVETKLAEEVQEIQDKLDSLISGLALNPDQDNTDAIIEIVAVTSALKEAQGMLEGVLELKGSFLG